MRLRRQGAVCQIQTRRLNFPEKSVECDLIVCAEIGNQKSTGNRNEARFNNPTFGAVSCVNVFFYQLTT